MVLFRQEPHAPDEGAVLKLVVYCLRQNVLHIFSKDELHTHNSPSFALGMIIPQEQLVFVSWRFVVIPECTRNEAVRLFRSDSSLQALENSALRAQVARVWKRDSEVS